MISGLYTRRGFTLLELLIVMCLVAALMTLFFPVYSNLREKARDAACVGNLRILQLGVLTYMQDHDEIWPQEPPEGFGDEEEPMWEWWYKELNDYGVSKRNWVCPSEVQTREQQDSTTEQFYGSYLPTMFEGTPRVAYMWAQPWFVENGQFHGDNHGPNVAMPDGTVRQGPALLTRQ